MNEDVAAKSERPVQQSSGSEQGLVKRFQDKCCAIGKEYLPYQVYFFSFFAGIGAFLPYLVLYLKQLGLSAGQAGVLYGFRPLSEVLIPLYGWLGDRYKIRMAILRLALISYALSALFTLLVQPKHQRCVERGGNVTHAVPLVFSSDGTVGFDDSMAHNGSGEYERLVEHEESDKMFAVIFLITVLGQIIGCVNFTFPEALTVALLEEKAEKFGAVRFPGEVSIAVSTFAVGAALSHSEKEVCGQMYPNYFIAFYCFAAWMVACLIVTFCMKTKYHDPPENIVGLKEVICSMADLKSVSLLFVSVFLGAFLGLHESFGLWYIKDLGGSSLVVGVASGLRYTFSSLGYITSAFLITRLGVLVTLSAVSLSYGLLFAAFSLSHTPGLATGFFVLQGGLYSVAWCSVIAHVGMVSQRTGYTASIQGAVHFTRTHACRGDPAPGGPNLCIWTLSCDLYSWTECITVDHLLSSLLWCLHNTSSFWRNIWRPPLSGGWGRDEWVGKEGSCSCLAFYCFDLLNSFLLLYRRSVQCRVLGPGLRWRGDS